MYQSCNDDDEFEPRITPKPASMHNSFLTPSVPEVSLVFDKPVRAKTLEYRSVPSLLLQSTDTKGLTYKTDSSSSPDNNGSYAAWKEQNFAWKPTVSRPSDRASPSCRQHNRNENVQSFSPERTTTDILKEQRERGEHNYSSRNDFNHVTKYREHRNRTESYNNSYKSIPQTRESNRLSIKQKLNGKTQCNNAANNTDASNLLQSIIRHPNVENAAVYSHNREEYPQFSSNRKLTAHNSEQQKILVNGPMNKPIILNGSVNQNMYSKNEFQPLPHLGYQYPYIDVNTYPFSQIYATGYPSHNTDNQETVKNLLQLINSQSEQIKTLQLQVDRLLKIQEQNLKDKLQCVCMSRSTQQNEVLRVNSYNATGSSNCITQPKNQSSIKDGTHTALTNEKREDEFNENRNCSQPEFAFPDAQAKKTYMEQKVSIGVMTSFEFTVQNSPFALDSENYEKQEYQRKHESVPNGLNMCDTSEALRRYKNSFTRVPSVQLENIVEDSESYLSSSHQQSSNMNGSISAKDIEKPTPADAQREIQNCRSDSPRSCEAYREKLNQSKTDAQRYLEKLSNGGINQCDFRKRPLTQINIDAHNARGRDTHKRNGSINADQRTEFNTQNRNSPVNVNFKSTPTVQSKRPQSDGNGAVSKQVNRVEDSLILSGGDLNVAERPPPTPEQSIHVDMQEYSSDDDSEKVKRTSKVGWTFYNNVLGQVNQILQNSCVKDDQEQNQTKANHNIEQDDAESRAVKDTVKYATLEQLRKLGISISENPELKDTNGANKMAFDSSYYPRLECQSNVAQATSAVTETNTSMHMKALALKYLSDEQLAEVAFQRQGSTALKQLMLSNVQATNMSFATMRYLERYQLLPGKNNLQAEGNAKIHAEIPSKPDLRSANPKTSPATQRFAFSQTPRTTCPSKILDISTLKQQPKLL